MMQELKVALGARSYPIYIGTGILEALPRLMDEWISAARIAVVTDSHVADLYLKTVSSGLERAGKQALEIIIPAGEESKSLATIERIFDNLIAHNWDRFSPLIALGGGVVGDITGFAAATFMRGVPYVQVPTSLLAMVDSSVGGKTGVNHPKGKNLIGAFYQPRLVVADLNSLISLPAKELAAALAEVIKYGVISDPELFDYLERRLDDLLKLDLEALDFVVGRCCRIKAGIVAADEREAGIRAILNFGHTLGHAIEQASGYSRYRHGEAVALGMIAAAEFSQMLGYCDKEVPERIKALIAKAGLPGRLNRNVSPEAVIRAAGIDKKRSGNLVNFVFTNEIGKVVNNPCDLDKYNEMLLRQLTIFR